MKTRNSSPGNTFSQKVSGAVSSSNVANTIVVSVINRTTLSAVDPAEVADSFNSA